MHNVGRGLEKAVGNDLVHTIKTDAAKDLVKGRPQNILPDAAMDAAMKIVGKKLERNILK